jgi:hypothetical protein
MAQRRTHSARWLLVVFVLTVLGIGTFVALDPRTSGPEPEPDPATRSEHRSSGDGSSGSTPSAGTRDALEPPRDAGNGTRPQDESPPAADDARRITRQRWDALKAALEDRRQPHRSVAAASVPTEPDPPRGQLAREYIQAAIQEIKPLLAECYDLARHEDADIEGRLIVDFRIGGDPGVGGIVEEARIHDDSPLRHRILDECVRESIYVLELPAPEEGGHVRVTYPFDFAHEPPQTPENTRTAHTDVER